MDWLCPCVYSMCAQRIDTTCLYTHTPPLHAFHSVESLCYFFLFVNICWRITALEHRHCHTQCKSATSPRGPPPSWTAPAPITAPSSGGSQGTGPSPLCRVAPSRWLAACPWQCMSQCYPLGSSRPLPPPLCPKSVLYVCVSLPALQVSSSVPLLGRYLESQLIYKGPVSLKVQRIESEIHMRAGLPAPPEVAKGPGDQMEAILQDVDVYVYRLCVCTCRDFTLTFQIQETNPFSTTHLPALVVADSINLLICVFHSRKF